jgi:hypothetical protein
MAYSTIPAAKAQILSVLAALPGLASARVQRGLPSGDPPPQHERVYVDKVVDITRDWIMLGRRRLDESYTVLIPVEVFEYDSNGDPAHQAICEDRMWTLIAEIELALIGDLTLGGILHGNTERPSGIKPGGIDEQNTFPATDGWVSHAVLRIDCAARI